MLTLTKSWETTYPNASIGILAMKNVANPKTCAALQTRKTALEAELRERFAGKNRADIKALPEFQAYTAYYKRFKKTYHIQLQLESVALKGKPIPSVAALVETMFMGELKNFLLTAVHDLDIVQQPISINVADGSESYVMMSNADIRDGKEQTLKPGDMYIADAEGILSSIIYGPDARTQVTTNTRNVLFTVYAPKGIAPDAVQRHLEDMRDFVKLVAPNSKTTALETYYTLGSHD